MLKLPKDTEEKTRCQGKEDCHTRQSSVQSEEREKDRERQKERQKERERKTESSCVGSCLKTETFGKKSHRIGLISQPWGQDQ